MQVNNNISIVGLLLIKVLEIFTSVICMDTRGFYNQKSFLVFYIPIALIDVIIPFLGGNLLLMVDLPVVLNAKLRIASDVWAHFPLLLSPFHSICSGVPLMVQYQLFQGESDLEIEPLMWKKKNKIMQLAYIDYFSSYGSGCIISCLILWRREILIKPSPYTWYLRRIGIDSFKIPNSFGCTRKVVSQETTSIFSVKWCCKTPFISRERTQVAYFNSK